VTVARGRNNNPIDQQIGLLVVSRDSCELQCSFNVFNCYFCSFLESLLSPEGPFVENSY